MVPEKIEGLNVTFTSGTNDGEEYVGLDMEMDPPFEDGPNSASIQVQDGGDIVSIHLTFDGAEPGAVTAGPRSAIKVLLLKALAMLAQNEVEHTVLEADQNPAR
jgi:hypothetical protein